MRRHLLFPVLGCCCLVLLSCAYVAESEELISSQLPKVVIKNRRLASGSKEYEEDDEGDTPGNGSGQKCVTVLKERYCIDQTSKIEKVKSGLNGKIPVRISRLTNLKKLDLSQNQFHGEIPTEIGLLTGLTELSLAGNKLQGTLPTNLGSLSNLRVLSLNSNRLTGNVPTQFSNFKKLEVLELYSNDLEGKFSFDDWPELRQLRIGFNKFSGSLSLVGSYRKLKYGDLEVLNMQSNKFTGTLPSQLGRLTSLVRLKLGWNEFHGEIPSQLGELDSLRTLLLHENRLSGTLPKQLAQLNLEEFSAWGPYQTLCLPGFTLPFEHDLTQCTSSYAPTNSNPTTEPLRNYPTAEPATVEPSWSPTTEPPTNFPTPQPTTVEPSRSPITKPPTNFPTPQPTTKSPTNYPTPETTSVRPSWSPTTEPPTNFPTHQLATVKPSWSPTTEPPTNFPTPQPITESPTNFPTREPITESPSSFPTPQPTTRQPTSFPTPQPTTESPTNFPTPEPITVEPSWSPTTEPPTNLPTREPTTQSPSSFPTPLPIFESPTNFPSTASPSSTPTSSTSTSTPTITPTGHPSSIGNSSNSPKNIVPQDSEDSLELTYVIYFSVFGFILVCGCIISFFLRMTMKQKVEAENSNMSENRADEVFVTGVQYGGVMSVVITISDVVTDVLLAAQLFQTEGTYVLGIASLFFIAAPITINIGIVMLLSHAITANTLSREWIEKNDFLFSFVQCLSIFSVEILSLASSGIGYFTLPLRKVDVYMLRTYSMINNVLEDIPQLVIVVLANAGQDEWLPFSIIAILSSLSSLIWTVLFRFQACSILYHSRNSPKISDDSDSNPSTTGTEATQISQDNFKTRLNLI